MSVGIDIGSKTIKVVELAWEGGKPVLKASGIVGVKDASIDRIQDEGEMATLANTIKGLFRDAKISSKEVSIALPETQVFTRSLKFPTLTDQEIASAVKWQAEEVVPIPAKEAIFQHMIIERRENAVPPEVLVLVVAAPRALIEKYMKILTMAGVTVTGVETEMLALSRAVAPAGQTVLVADFGAKSTDIGIAKNEKLVFSRSIPTAGDAFTRAIAQTMGINPVQAEEYKKTYGLSGTQMQGKVAAAVSPIFKIVVEEIKKAIHFYQTDEKGETPNLVILSGGTAGLPEAAPQLAKLLGVEVVIANPFAKVSVSPEIAQNIANYAPLYSIAVGLALRGG
ncbi:MAG TPA: type IV pilus assembly protein PilM [Candidatus Saccharimonadales bacterium]|nr:type IV pilus assembly protein PilM [Candidatus Saccharimonadales bacterium]